MAEPTIALKRADIAVRAAAYLGWGLGKDNGDVAYDATKLFYLKDFIDSACRLVYQAAVGGKTYDWSWLKPVANSTFSSGTTSVRLPDDFGGLEGDLVVAPTANLVLWPVKIVSEEQVRQRLAESPTRTGRPEVAAVQWQRGTSLTAGQRANLVFAPQADQDYPMRLTYYLIPDALTDQSPYAYGGAGMSETYLEGCLAVAEQRLDNTRGIHSENFDRLLAASIDQDRRNKAQTLGYNRDRSDEAGWYWGGRRCGDTQPVSFQGVVYGG